MFALDVEWIKVEHVVKTASMTEVAKELEGLQINLSTTEDDDTKDNLEQKMQQLQDKLAQMSQTRRFKLTPHTKTVVVKVKQHRMAMTKMEFKCCMHQLPVNLNNSMPGHEL